MLTKIYLGILIFMQTDCSQHQPERLVVRAGRLFNGTNDPIQTHVRLVIENGVIVRSEPDQAPFPVTSKQELVLDATSQTIIPGLIDSHVHIFIAGACTIGIGAGLSAASHNLHAILKTGVTTIADLGAPAWAAVALRDFIGVGQHRGPRLLVAGPMITSPNGFPMAVMGNSILKAGGAITVDSEISARAIVRQLARQRVDFIKVALQDVWFNQQSLPILSKQTLCALVDEAHRQELRVIAHVVSNAGYALAMECQVDVMTHSPIEPVDTNIVQTLAQKHIPVIPTLFVLEAPLWGTRHWPPSETSATLWSRSVKKDLQNAALLAQKNQWNDIQAWGSLVATDQIQRASSANTVNTKILAESQVILGAGTDYGSCFVGSGSFLQELKRLAALGLSLQQVLQIATSGSAYALGLQDALGKLLPGYRADLVVVDGRPDETIDDLNKIQYVVIDGQVQNLAPLSWTKRIQMLARMLGAWLGKSRTFNGPK